MAEYLTHTNLKLLWISDADGHRVVLQGDREKLLIQTYDKTEAQRVYVATKAHYEQRKKEE